MSENLQAILSELKAGLEDLYQDNLVKVLLYGSQARGDAREGSDIDVMIVLRGDFRRSAEMERTSHLISDLSLKYDTVISRFFVSEAAFEEQQSPLLRNVRRKGVPL